MRPTVFFIITLLVAVIAAPIVDAIACDDCKDIMPLRLSQRITKDAVRSESLVSSCDAGASDSQRTATAQDICPVCSNIAAAVGNACCSAPFIISQANHLSKLIALSEPSYSITKPPQN